MKRKQLKQVVYWCPKHKSYYTEFNPEFVARLDDTNKIRFYLIVPCTCELAVHWIEIKLNQ